MQHCSKVGPGKRKRIREDKDKEGDSELREQR
jgi:hypothetical protein